MEEIKFKCWDKVGLKMYYDVYFDKCHVKKWDELTDQEYTIPLPFAELMQYTGLKDKNGTEIYEGDICQFYMFDEIAVGLIEWHDESAGFRIDDCPINLFGLQIEKVIGNKYENPELMEKTNG